MRPEGLQCSVLRKRCTSLSARPESSASFAALGFGSFWKATKLKLCSRPRAKHRCGNGCWSRCRAQGPQEASQPRRRCLFPLDPLMSQGLKGGTQIRTGGKGFAILCLTTWPCRRLGANSQGRIVSVTGCLAACWS